MVAFSLLHATSLHHLAPLKQAPPPYPSLSQKGGAEEYFCFERRLKGKRLK
jgi:hypothetical protein